MAFSLGTEISMPRQAACQTLWENQKQNMQRVPKCTSSAHLPSPSWTIYARNYQRGSRTQFPKRLAIDAFSLVPATFVYNTASVNRSEVPEGLNVLKEHWAADLPNCEKVEMEYRMWVEKSQWKRLAVEGHVIPTTVSEYLVACHGNFYSNIQMILKLLCILLVTTSECEKSISHIRTWKNCLRSTVGQAHLNGLALMKIHRNIPLNLVSAVDTFVRLFDSQMILLPKKLMEGE